jgi:hypothetical protein
MKMSLLKPLFRKKENITMTTNTIKIMKPVMQEVEVSREELVNTLMKRNKSDSKFAVGDLVTANVEDSGYGYGSVKGIAVITHVNPKRKQHPITNVTLDKPVNSYTINYFDCNNCIKTFLYATDSELTALES